MGQFEVDFTQDIGGNARLVSLRPKTSDDCFDYEAGQYVAVGFERYGRRTPMRCFSIVSSPSQQELQIAVRVQGNFTSALDEIQTGDIVYVQGPFGEFTINPLYDRNAVFIAGGIGITPFMSMLRQIRDSRLPCNVTLLYRTGKNGAILFKDELLELQAAIPNFHVIFFVGEDGSAQIPGAVVVNESISERRLQQITSGKFTGITYFICGPKGFMNAIEQTLFNNGVNPDRIITESFAQSSKLQVGERWSAQRLTYAFASFLVLVGVGGIMSLDLARSVPRLVNAQSVSSTSSNATTTQTTTSSSDDSSTTTSASAPTTSTTTAPTTTQPTPAPVQYYRQPVSSVS